MMSVLRGGPAWRVGCGRRHRAGPRRALPDDLESPAPNFEPQPQYRKYLFRIIYAIGLTGGMLGQRVSATWVHQQTSCKEAWAWPPVPREFLLGMSFLLTKA